MLCALAYSQDLYLDEEFETNQLEWQQMDDENFMSVIKAGQLFIEHKRIKGEWDCLTSFFLDQSREFTIEAKMRQIRGVRNHGYGISWGGKDADNINQFVVSSDGHVRINQRFYGEYWEVLGWTNRQDVINDKGQYNLLKIHVNGKRAEFFVNDSLVHASRRFKFFGDQFGFTLNHQMAVAVDYIKVYQNGNEIETITGASEGQEMRNLGKAINSSFDELTPRITHDGHSLFFTRANHPNNTAMDDNDIWVSTIGNNGAWTEARNIGHPLNNEGHNAVVSISPDGNTLLLSNTYKEDGKPMSQGLSIANKTKDGWEIPKTLHVRHFVNKHNVISSCMAPDKKTIIFAIRTDDTQGGTDLYVSFAKGDHYTEPVNMGSVINSFGDESTPFLASDNQTIYFSSDGRPGYGSHDIFVSRRLDNSWLNWSRPKNMGPDINSEGWDAYFTIPSKGAKAYLVSGSNSYGGHDIFEIEVPASARPLPTVEVKGQVLSIYDSLPIPAQITYNNLATNYELGKASVNPITGEYKILLPYGEDYSFVGEHEGYYPISNRINLKADTGLHITKHVDIYMVPLKVGEVVRMNNLFFDSDQAEIKKESYSELARLARLLKSNPAIRVEIAGHTDDTATATHNLGLSKRRASAVMNYLLEQEIEASRIVAKGYGESKPIDTNSTEEGKLKNRRVEFKILAL